jgi:Predicted transcriptional regulators
MKTIQLPLPLITSLSELGLLESEAKIYSALVLLGYAEVKDLLEVLDVSKPRIYDGLRTLEELGLITQTSPRPAIYQAVAPQIAMAVLMKKHEAAKDEVLAQFRALERRPPVEKPEPPLCYLFGSKSFEFKIRDMLEHARESICCQMSAKYAGEFEKLAGKGIRLQMILLSEDTKAQKRLERAFGKGNAEIMTLTRNQMISAALASGSEKARHMAMDNTVDIDNIFMLIVDDAELLFVPPLKTDSLGAISSTNKGMVFMMKNMITERFEAGKP